MASHATGDGNIPSRDANKKGLKRIMTVGGVYGTRNYTVKDLRDQKGKKTLTETVPFSVEEAAAAEEAGIDTMKVRFDPKNPELAIAIRNAAPNTFMAFSCPLIAAATKDEAVRLGYRAMEIGADVILKGTKVDGIYEEDPMKNPDSHRFEEISYTEVLKRRLEVMDATAISLCRENGMPIAVFNMNGRGNIARMIAGDTSIGTVVVPD